MVDLQSQSNKEKSKSGIFVNKPFLNGEEQILIITPKHENSIYEMIEEDEDLINLVDGNTYFRVWRDGEFEVNKLPEKGSDGSIILSTDSLLRVSHNTETNINIDLENEEEWEKFWKTHTVSHYIIKNGFDEESET